MRKHPFNFAFSFACIIAIAFTARWYVTVLAILAAIEWKLTPEVKEAWREAWRQKVADVEEGSEH